MTVTPIAIKSTGATGGRDKSLPLRNRFQMHGAFPLSSTGVDAAFSHLESIEAISTLLDAATRDSAALRQLDKSSDFENLKEEYHATAWRTVGQLAAQASFELAQNEG